MKKPILCYGTLMLQISHGGGPAMDSENVLRLQKCREELVSSLEFDLMSPCLIQYNLLTTSEYDNIKLKPGNSDKVMVICMPLLLLKYIHRLTLS